MTQSNIKPNTKLNTKEDILAWLKAYDMNGDLSIYTITDTLKVNAKGNVHLNTYRQPQIQSLPVQFGTVKGDFIIQGGGLTTLEGSPRRVEGVFDCSGNSLRTLEHSPSYAFRFDCSHNEITDLAKLATDIRQSFNCSYNQLGSLKGMPGQINFDFDCSHNLLTTLSDCASYVKGKFDCSHNLLESLELGPREVGQDYLCQNNRLTTLKGCSQFIRKSFNCAENHLKDFQGGPKSIYMSMTCGGNLFHSFDGLPERIGGSFHFGFNAPLHLEGFSTELTGSFSHDLKNEQGEEVEPFEIFVSEYAYDKLYISQARFKEIMERIALQEELQDTLPDNQSIKRHKL